MPPKASGGAGSARRAAGAGAGASGGGQPGGILKKPVVSSAGAGAAAGQAPGSDRNKVVVRRCPPELPEQVFWQTVEPWIKDDAADWKLYKQGRSRKHGSNKESVNSVAYIHFKRQEQVASFAAAYQGHTFRDSKGNRFQVIVQYAPFQKIPPKKVKPDPLSGTIDDDAEFKAFEKSLTEPEETKVADTADAATPAKGVKKTTPLLEELRRKKQENARKKAEGVKQSRSAKRAAARAAAAATAPGSSPALTAATEKMSAADIKALKKAERSKKRKERRQEERRAIASMGIPEATNITKPDQKPVKAPASKTKPAPAAKQAEAPPKMTILAPPRSANDSKKEEQPKAPLPPAGKAAPPAASPSEAAKPASVAQPPKPKPSLSAFDDIVGQFAKQMQSKPVKKPAPSASENDKTKPAAVANGQKPEAKRSVSSSRGQKLTSPKTGAPPLPGTTSTGPLSPNPSEAREPTTPSARGRGRGGMQRGGRKGASAGRGGPLSPNATTATPAPS